MGVNDMYANKIENLDKIKVKIKSNEDLFYCHSSWCHQTYILQ